MNDDASRMNYFLLCFADSSVEASFRAEQVRKALGPIRVALLVPIVVIVLFWALADQIVPSVPLAPTRLALPLALILATFALLYGFTHWRAIRAYLANATVLAQCVVSAAITWIAVLLPPSLLIPWAATSSVSASYTAPQHNAPAFLLTGTLILLVIHTLNIYSILRLRFLPAVVTGWVSAAMYLVYLGNAGILTGSDLITHTTVLVVANVFGMVTAYQVDLFARREYSAMRMLADAGRHKSEFLANMSHELRTPLNAIIGVTEMLHEDARDLRREVEIEPLERVLRAARHLLALINDILDLSKIEAGKMDIHYESFSIAPLIEDVVQTIATMATKNGNRVVVDCASDIGMMHSDPTRLRQALLNLASNANKFTERGRVTISAKRSTQQDCEWVTIAITDTGIGLTVAQMRTLFQNFVQADTSTTRKYGGTGLGLAISRRFCQMMGGDIAVDSEVGHGSTFTIRLPAHAPVPEDVTVAQKSSQSSLRELASGTHDHRA